MSYILTEFRKKYPNCELLLKLEQNWHIFLDIFKNCKVYKCGCGSYLFDGITYDYDPKMYEKQKLLYEKAKNATNLLEVGVYMGHSLFIILLANPTLNIVCIDIDDFLSKPAIDVLVNNFPNASINFIKGNSNDVLPTLDKTFDLFHIDGDHTPAYINREFEICLTKAMPKDIYFIFDDYDLFPSTVDNFSKYSSEHYKAIFTTIPNCAWRNALINLSYF